MTAKEYLSRLRTLEIRMTSSANEIENLTNIATSITSAINSDGIHTTGTTSDKLGNCVARIVDIQREINADVDEYSRLRKETIDLIDELPTVKHRELLRMRYVGNMTFEQIAIAMDMSWRHTVRLHGYALREFGEKNRDFLKKTQKNL
jgi:DNA-directed RNA polymerase specialized sigma subunit